MKKLIFILIAFFLVNFMIYGATYNSFQSGDWTNVTTWTVSGAFPSVAPTTGDVVNINGHDVIFSVDIAAHEINVSTTGSLKLVSPGTSTTTLAMTVNAQGDFTVYGEVILGTLEVGHQMDFLIADGGNVEIYGDFVASSSGTKIDPFEVNGAFNVMGSLDISGHVLSDITGSGCVYGGSYTLNGNTVFGESPVSGSVCGGTYKNWAGGTSGVLYDWYTDTNWEPAGVPTVGDGVVIPNVTYYPKVSSSQVKGVAKAGNIVINTSSTLTINPDGQLTTYGVVNNTETDGIVIESSDDGTGSFIFNSIGTNGTVNRYMSTPGYWHYITTPIIYGPTDYFSTLDMGLEPGVGAGNDQFYYWDESENLWYDILNETSGPPVTPSLLNSMRFNLGQGYAITYGTSSPTLAFRGEMNVASKTVGVTSTSPGGDFQGANLIGNPFTSTIAINSYASANNFLTDNADSLAEPNGAVYLWQEEPFDWTQTNYDYRTITHATEATFLQPGQGFMVMVDSTTKAVTFNSSIRAHGSANFYKSGGEISRFGIYVTNPKSVSNSTLIAFKEGMTNGLDRAWDGAKLFGNPDLGLYTKLVDGSWGEFAVQALPPTNEETTVKLGLRAQIIGKYTLRPYTIENFNYEYSITLEDKQTGNIVNFSDRRASYTFNIDSPGAFDSRFELHFTTVVGVNDPSSISPNKNIQTYVSGNTLHVVDDGVGSGMVEIFNLLGQQLMQESYENSYNTFSLSLSAGSYIIRVISDGSVTSNKIHVN